MKSTTTTEAMITTEVTEVVDIKKNKGGRPSKKALAATKKRGRPPETTGRIAELKARLLATSGEKVVNEIIRKALDPEDKDQIAALKMCIDRILPVSLFEKSAGRSNQIQINISTGDGQPATIEENTIEIEDAVVVDEEDDDA
jgi:hypothetical protein